MVWVRNCEFERVAEHGHRLGKHDTVFGDVRCRFSGIPFELHPSSLHQFAASAESPLNFYALILISPSSQVCLMFSLIQEKSNPAQPSTKPRAAKRGGCNDYPSSD